MSKQLLIADDDESTRKIVSRIFRQRNWEIMETDNGIDAMNMINKNKPDLVILDVFMPEINGMEVLRKLRRNGATSFVPVIMLTGADTAADKVNGFEFGADEYMAKPFKIDELVLRAENLLNRTRKNITANPLTLLPGGPAIEEEANCRIKSSKTFAFMHIDIDNFKAYNDVYGYLNGDAVIKKLASMLVKIQEERKNENVFVGHIGGDDFVLIADEATAEKIASGLAAGFDETAPCFYSPEDRMRGRITATDRAGNQKTFPFISLTIAIASNEKRNFNHYAKLVDIASEIKKYLKSFKDRAGSMYMKDRRKD
ncbi:MAG: response regulator [Elusimicrobia bacterium]|nr:response regulator [Elusimicrobiota bacterium]